MRRARPPQAVDGCYDKSSPASFIAERLGFTSAPTTKSSTLNPVYANPRFQAGGPLGADVLECQVKPLNVEDYNGAVLTDGEGAAREDLPVWRVRLVETRRERGAGSDLGVVRPVAATQGQVAATQGQTELRCAQCGDASMRECGHARLR
jgi:hypothetical protein